MTDVHNRLHAGHEMLSPVGRRKEQVLRVGYISPDDHSVQHSPSGLDLGLRHLKREGVDAFHEARNFVGIQSDPKHHTLTANDPPKHLVSLTDAAIDGNVRMERAHGIDPGWQIADEAISHSSDLIVAAAEVPSFVPGIIELKCPHLLDRIGVEVYERGHGTVALPLNHRFEAGANQHLILVLLEDLELLDVGIHIGAGGNPVQVIVSVDVRISRKAELIPPTLDEATPEEVADRHSVGRFVAQGFGHPINLR